MVSFQWLFEEKLNTVQEQYAGELAAKVLKLRHIVKTYVTDANEINVSWPPIDNNRSSVCPAEGQTASSTVITKRL